VGGMDLETEISTDSGITNAIVLMDYIKVDIVALANFSVYSTS